MIKSRHLSSPAAYAKLVRWAVTIQKSDTTDELIRERVKEQVFNFNHAVPLDNVFLQGVADEVFEAVAADPKTFTAVGEAK